VGSGGVANVLVTGGASNYNMAFASGGSVYESGGAWGFDKHSSQVMRRGLYQGVTTTTTTTTTTVGASDCYSGDPGSTSCVVNATCDGARCDDGNSGTENDSCTPSGDCGGSLITTTTVATTEAPAVTDVCGITGAESVVTAGVTACWIEVTSAQVTEFKISSGKAWSSIGFTTGTKMSDGIDIMWCGDLNDGTVALRSVWSSGQTEPTGGQDASEDDTFSDIAVSRLGNTRTCSFKRRFAPVGGSRRRGAGTLFTTGGESSYNLALASGSSVYKLGGAWGFDKHDSKSVLPSKYQGAASAGSDFDGLLCPDGSINSFPSTGKIGHGILMLLGWALCSPVATITARFMKPTLGPLWYKIHMRLQVFAGLCTLVGTIAIFLDPEGTAFVDLSGPNRTHGMIGLAICAMTTVQILLGRFRNWISQHSHHAVHATEGPTANLYPHGRRRWLFNLLHKSFGGVLLPLTLLNVGLGLSLSDSCGVAWIATIGSSGWVALLLLCAVLCLRAAFAMSEHD
jgi:hypothetical protein